jgi:hypothetical protein
VSGLVVLSSVLQLMLFELLQCWLEYFYALSAKAVQVQTDAPKFLRSFSKGFLICSGKSKKVDRSTTIGFQ